MTLIHNKRTKLLATALNNVAVATFVTAIVAPVVGVLYGAPTPYATRWWWLVGALWFIVGIAPHLFAHAVLGRLKS